MEAEGKSGWFPCPPWDGVSAGSGSQHSWVLPGHAALEGLKRLREGNNLKFHTQLKMQLTQNYSVRRSREQTRTISTSSACPGSLCARRVGAHPQP